MGDGIQGPIWVQDLQGRVAELTLTMGLGLRLIKFYLHIERPERMLAYTFIAALVACVLTFWEMGLSFGLGQIKGLLVASGALTAGMIGTGKIIDYGAGAAGMDLKRFDADHRQTRRVKL